MNFVKRSASPICDAKLPKRASNNFTRGCGCFTTDCGHARCGRRDNREEQSRLIFRENANKRTFALGPNKHDPKGAAFCNFAQFLRTNTRRWNWVTPSPKSSVFGVSIGLGTASHASWPGVWAEPCARSSSPPVRSTTQIVL